MNGYLLVHEACDKAEITSRMLNRLIADGKVRVKDTCFILKGRSQQVRYVAYQDIIDAQTGFEPDYVDIQHVSAKYGITPQAVRQQIQKHRVRWRRVGAHLQPCGPDLDMFREAIQPSKAS